MKLKGREMGGFVQIALNACVTFSIKEERGARKLANVLAMQAASKRTRVQIPRIQVLGGSPLITPVLKRWGQGIPPDQDGQVDSTNKP